jgi:hypothetical protein
MVRAFLNASRVVWYRDVIASNSVVGCVSWCYSNNIDAFIECARWCGNIIGRHTAIIGFVSCCDRYIGYVLFDV